MGDPPADQRTLTIEIERIGDRFVSTYTPVIGEPAKTRVNSLFSKITWAAEPSLTGMGLVNALLDRGILFKEQSGAHLDAVPHIGRELFRLLFGDDSRHDRMFNTLFGNDPEQIPADTPMRHPVRVRIVTRHAALIGLPWGLTSYNNLRLIEPSRGWTFELTQTRQPTRHFQLQRPCRILVFAPFVSAEVEPASAGHIEALRSTLGEIWPGHAVERYCRVIHHLDELAPALADGRPDIFYYYGRCQMTEGQIALQPQPEAAREAYDLTLSRLLTRWGEPLPMIAYINGRFIDRGCRQSGGLPLGPGIPCVIANRRGDAGPELETTAIAWLRRVLDDGHDPVVAAHHPERGHRTSVQPWAALTVHADYSTWSTGEKRPAKHRSMETCLNRIHQRRVAYDETMRMVQADDRRVLSLVGCGGPGSHLCGLGAMVATHLELRGLETLAVKRRKVSFPAGLTVNPVLLQTAINRAFEWPSGGAVEQQALRRSAPKARRGVQPVLLLDWGVLQANDMLDERQIRQNLTAWLVYHHDQLAKAVPADLRVVSLVTWQLAERKHHRFTQWMKEQQLDLRSPGFTCVGLEPAGKVELIDLIESLEECTDCPDSVTRSLAELILRDTMGHYEDTLALLERVQQVGCLALKLDLEAKYGKGGAASDKDEW